MRKGGTGRTSQTGGMGIPSQKERTAPPPAAVIGNHRTAHQYGGAGEPCAWRSGVPFFPAEYFGGSAANDLAGAHGQRTEFSAGQTAYSSDTVCGRADALCHEKEGKEGFPAPSADGITCLSDECGGIPSGGICRNLGVRRLSGYGIFCVPDHLDSDNGLFDGILRGTKVGR